MVMNDEISLNPLPKPPRILSHARIFIFLDLGKLGHFAFWNYFTIWTRVLILDLGQTGSTGHIYSYVLSS